MSVTYVVGVDPGLVNTGVVGLMFDSAEQEILISHKAFVGCDAADIHSWVKGFPYLDDIFIEGYKPRSNYGTDLRMIEMIKGLKIEMKKAKVLNNTGVKKVVRHPLMDLLGVWDFPTPTHHQDLRSAARILLFGMLKDPAYNLLLSDVVRAHINGDDWKVEHR